MRFKNLKIGQLFEIYNDDNVEVTTTRGRITSIDQASARTVAVQFDDEIGTYMWGDLEEGTRARGLTLLEDAE
jgi:uncharacterized Zn finger protein